MGAKQLICCLGPSPAPAPVPSPSPSPAPSPAPAPSPRASNVKFRVLIIGRANAGKTSILQRVCDTTESPVIYRYDPSGTSRQVKFEPTIERGLHNIEDELIFTNHDGYVFHDSRGFEAGSEDELKIVQEFVTRKSREKRLRDRLHAIWYCIPMDNNRPLLDLKHFGDICPDKNVPVIAVFTKYDQFKRNIRMKLEDEGRDPDTHFHIEVESAFDRYYLASLSGPPPFVRLERMHKHDQPCTDLIEVTANALSGGIVALMLLAVQRDNLEVNVKKAVEWTHELNQRDWSAEFIIRPCIAAFPSIWFEEFFREERDLDMDEDELFERRRRMRMEDFVFRFDRRRQLRVDLIFDQLSSFYSNPRLCISTTSRFDPDHVMIATVLILEYAAILFASPPHPPRREALDKACSQFIYSNTHNAVNRLFLLSPKPYSIQQFTEFLLIHRLR